MSLTCSSTASTAGASSSIPLLKAKPEDVVASALKPRCRRYIAEPTSQGFGSTKQPSACKLLKASTAVRWVSLIYEKTSFGSDCYLDSSMQRVCANRAGRRGVNEAAKRIPGGCVARRCGYSRTLLG